MDLCVNKALLMLRDDPLPLPYSPMAIKDQLRKIRWFRADQLSHHTMVAATSPSAKDRCHDADLGYMLALTIGLFGITEQLSTALVVPTLLVESIG